MTPDKQIRSDMEFLSARAEFRRFLWRAIQMGGFFDHTGAGKSERDLGYAGGRRDLLLELLADAELGQPATHPEAIPILTTIQILREEAQQPRTEKAKGRNRYDEPGELDEPDGDDQR